MAKCLTGETVAQARSVVITMKWSRIVRTSWMIVANGPKPKAGSTPGQAVCEPFIGSGTTLIAAETTGRVCHGIELNPAYVDVAVERWQQFTGQTAVLTGDERTFDDLKAEGEAA
jgi:hypothetical protein